MAKPIVVITKTFSVILYRFAVSPYSLLAPNSCKYDPKSLVPYGVIEQDQRYTST